MSAPSRSRRTSFALGVIAHALGGIAWAQLPDAPAGAAAAADADAALAPVVVTATRNARRDFDVPASIDAVDAARAGGAQLRVNLSDVLAGVPGIVAQNRQNFAQDLQISSRGFGARSTFGVRGVRLYVDGIPATMPDGQGQVSHVDLASAARIEVLRGPFSALHGNASGGVIAVFTQDGGPDTLAGVSTAFGSDGTARVGLQASGRRERVDYTLSASRFATDGPREHAAAERTNFNGKLRYAAGDDTRWTVVANGVRLPEAQDPLGLTQADFRANPRQAPAAALLFDTRKTVAQDQLGVTLDHRISATDALQWTTYAGTRDTLQFLAVPVDAQRAATSPGGVVDLTRSYGGTDARWIRRLQLLGTPATVTAGVAWDALDERRRGFLNFRGPASAPTQRGVMGELRRDERNRVRSADQYVQAEWAIAERWSTTAGLRHSRVRFRSDDAYLANGDDSGAVDYRSTMHAVGVVFHASDRVNAYATFGRGFETPTLNELAYRPDGSAGLNMALRPARSRQWEAGVKTRLGERWRVQLAWFEARTADEIVVQTNTGGRTSFRNAGSTLRRGVEASASGALPGGFGVAGAFTRLDARFRDAFAVCASAPCSDPAVPIAAGNRIPGIPRHVVHAELLWRRPAWGFETALAWRRVSDVVVDDRNTLAADGYAVASLRLSWRQRAGRWSLHEFVRVDNLANREHAGSVIVNEGNARYFEAAPGRHWLAGVDVLYRF